VYRSHCIDFPDSTRIYGWKRCFSENLCKLLLGQVLQSPDKKAIRDEEHVYMNRELAAVETIYSFRKVRNVPAQALGPGLTDKIARWTLSFS
jgi:hypothetical protein